MLEYNTCKRSNIRSKNGKKKPVFDNDFRSNAVRYVQQHTNLTMKECAANLGVGRSTLSRWISESKNQKTVL